LLYHDHYYSVDGQIEQMGRETGRDPYVAADYDDDDDDD